jgi:hypothetical protein
MALSRALILLCLVLLPASISAWEVPRGFGWEPRKLLQQANVPITAQCINLLDNSQVANIPNLNIGALQPILSLLGVGGQAPTAILFNSE